MVEKIPLTYQEALELLDNDEFTIIAGGTDLMVQKRGWGSSLPDFTTNTLFIKHIKELDYIIKDKHYIKVGALTTLTSLLENEHIPSIYKDALFEMASVGIRNEATIAGNIENASPAGDSLPVLYSLDAVVVLESVNGIREIPIIEYITGVRRTVRHSNELIKEVKIPFTRYTHKKWVKVGGRRADAISKISFVGLAEIENGTVLDLRISFGAVSPIVIRKRSFELQYIGMTVAELKEQSIMLTQLYNDLINPIDDQRSNKEYRRLVSLNILKDFIGEL